MYKVRIISIDTEGKWFQVYQDEGADDIKPSELSPMDRIAELVGGNTFTKWEIPDMENYVIQINK